MNTPALGTLVKAVSSLESVIGRYGPSASAAPYQTTRCVPLPSDAINARAENTLIEIVVLSLTVAANNAGNPGVFGVRVMSYDICQPFMQ